MLDALPQVEIKTASPWYQGVQTFSGPLLKDVLRLVGAKGTKLKILALNDYKTEVPLGDAELFRPILARKVNGVVLSPRDKGPLFLVYPYDSKAELRAELFYSRSAWQIKSIAVE